MQCIANGIRIHWVTRVSIHSRITVYQFYNIEVINNYLKIKICEQLTKSFVLTFSFTLFSRKCASPPFCPPLSLNFLSFVRIFTRSQIIDTFTLIYNPSRCNLPDTKHLLGSQLLKILINRGLSVDWIFLIDLSPATLGNLKQSPPIWIKGTLLGCCMYVIQRTPIWFLRAKDFDSISNRFLKPSS